MLELYQFEACPYCEKIRLILDYKQIPYQTIEITPGLGQIEIYRLSGQRRVPVLKDERHILTDSTAIATYLEQIYPEPALVPADARTKGLCWILEAWADDSIGPNARQVAIGAFNQHPNFRTALLPETTPDVVKTVLGAVPSDWLNFLGTGVGFSPEAIQIATTQLKQDLASLVLLLETQPYLLGPQPTLADFAIAAMTLYLKFPAPPFLNLPAGLSGKGIPGLADNPDYQRFWDWRDQLYTDFRRPSQPKAAKQPVKIGID
jgi:glutathione S-transferase